ncbi:hypothetical protein JTE90_013963 [Oedothorax gibbosus]|uniref:Uncharacterized protein n=1 Tax=Oedothorax gibbosus TaxID=931172 RepID=A0AAV6UDV1_9ARAC|nr:hypothetical protein JTE90_013963 [Oedothorax gibbosus]
MFTNVPIVKDNNSSGEYEVLGSKKENSISSLHQKEDPSSEHFIGKKRNLFSVTSVTDHASSTLSLGITKTSTISNPATTNSDATYEYSSTTQHPTDSQGTDLTKQSKNAISSTTGGGKEVTTTANGKDITTAAFSPETAKHGTENFLFSHLTSPSTGKPIAKHALENNNDNIVESDKSQAKDYRNEVQSVQKKILDPVKDINSNQGKNVFVSKENAVFKDNMFTTTTFLTLPTAAAQNLVPVEIRSKQSYESSTLGESVKGETGLNGTGKSNQETGTSSPVTDIKFGVKENNIKIISSQNDAIPLFVQNLLSSTVNHNSEVKLSRKKRVERKESSSSQIVKKASSNETQSTFSTTERNKSLPGIPFMQTNYNFIYLLPLLLSSSQLKNHSNITGTNSVEDVVEEATKSVSKIIKESSTANVIIGKINHHQEEAQEHQTATNEDIHSPNKKSVSLELTSNNNVLEYSTVSTKQDDKDVAGQKNVTANQYILLLVKNNNENETLATEEAKSKETIMDEYTRFVLSHYFDIQNSERDSNNSNLTNPDLLYLNEVHSPEPIKANGQNGTDPDNNVSNSDSNKPKDLLFLTVFSSWANNYSTGSPEHFIEEDPTFMTNTMVTAEFTTEMTSENGLGNGTTATNKTEFQNLAQKDESSIQGITGDLKNGIIIKDGSKNSKTITNEIESQKLAEKDENSMPRSTTEFTTAISINSDLENNKTVKNNIGFQNLSQFDSISIPGITAETTTEMTAASDMENNTKVANKNLLEKLMQGEASVSPNKDDLQGSKFNHIPLSNNVLEMSEIHELLNDFHNTTFTNKTGLVNLAHASSIPGISAELTTIITITSYLKNSTKLENEKELQNLAKKDSSSIPGITTELTTGITAELTTGITATSDLENNPNIANNGLEKLMQGGTSSSPNKDDLQGNKLNHVPLSNKNVSEMQKLFNSFHLTSTGLLDQREERV